MAAKRITQTAIDWSKLASIVPKAERQQFISFKAKSDAYLRRMLSYPETAPKIDWSHYKKNINDKAVVDQLESAYKALNITYPKDNISHEIDAQEAENKKEVESFVRDSEAIIAESKRLLQKMNLMIPVKDMTLEEFTLTFPEWSLRWQQPSWYPHYENTPGLTKEEREEIMKPEGPPYSLP